MYGILCGRSISKVDLINKGSNFKIMYLSMKKIQLFDKKIRNIKAELIDYPKYVLNNKDDYELLQQNKRFEKSHKGKRCFILGNGPSLKEVDFSLLGEEVVFTVNQLARNEKFDLLKSNYHFWADPSFFTEQDNNLCSLEILDMMKRVNSEDNFPECFFPIEFRKFVEKNGLKKILNVNYFATRLVLYENYEKKFDFTKFVPGVIPKNFLEIVMTY